MIYKTRYSSPLGKITICSDGTNLIGLWLENQKYFASIIQEEMIENNTLEIFKKTKNWLDRYFAGERPKISELQLAPYWQQFQAGSMENSLQNSIRTGYNLRRYSKENCTEKGSCKNVRTGYRRSGWSQSDFDNYSMSQSYRYKR